MKSTYRSWPALNKLKEDIRGHCILEMVLWYICAYNRVTSMCLQLGWDGKCTFIMGHSQKGSKLLLQCTGDVSSYSSPPGPLNAPTYPAPALWPLGPQTSLIPHQSSKQAFQQGYPRMQWKHVHSIFLSNTNHWPYHSWSFARRPRAFHPVYGLEFCKLLPQQGRLLSSKSEVFLESTETLFQPVFSVRL